MLGYLSGMSDRLHAVPEQPLQGKGASPSLLELALAFGMVGISGFGGVLPWARRVLVEQRGWLTPDAFNELFALCNFLPGPNIVNLSIVFGARARGPAGAIVAASALLGPPVLIVLGLGILYARFGDVAAIQRVLAGLAAAAAGLLAAMAAKMIEPLLRDRRFVGLAVAAAAFAAVGVARLPLIWVILVLAPVSIALAWRGHA